MPRREDGIKEVLRRKKRKIPVRRKREKARILGSYRNPVAFKFYGYYKDGIEIKHFEFSVVIPRSMKRRLMGWWVKRTVRDMKWEGELPEGHYYHTYRGFWNLHTKTDWVETDGIVRYNVDHTIT